MVDRFDKFFTDSVKEFVQEQIKKIETQEEADELADKIDKVDISQLYQKLLDETAKHQVENARKIMHENALLFRTEETEIIARIHRKWTKAFAVSEAMYLMVFEAVTDYSEFVAELEPNERDESIKTYTALKYIHGRGLQQYLEILTLMKNGFADGAYARWRSLYELNIIASFIFKYGEAVADSYMSSRDTEDRYEWARACGEFKTNKKYIRFDDIKNILRLVVRKSPTGESTHYFFFVLK